jgi:hypothetical protein
MSTRPDPRQCKKAIKILEQYERLARKLQVRLSSKRLDELDRLRDAGEITSADLPAKLQTDFPGEFAGMTLDAIRLKCSR